MDDEMLARFITGPNEWDRKLRGKSRKKDPKEIINLLSDKLSTEMEFELARLIYYQSKLILHFVNNPTYQFIEFTIQIQDISDMLIEILLGFPPKIRYQYYKLFFTPGTGAAIYDEDYHDPAESKDNNYCQNLIAQARYDVQILYNTIYQNSIEIYIPDVLINVKSFNDFIFIPAAEEKDRNDITKFIMSICDVISKRDIQNNETDD